MKLILVGCEYVGKTTLQLLITEWLQRNTGSHRPFFHDHFNLPSGESPPINSQLSVKMQEELMGLSPKLKEMFQRYALEYHLSPSFYAHSDHGLIGFHIEEAVYAPLYYGYGKPGAYADRQVLARSIEAEIMKKAPETVLILMKASPGVIVKRMRKNPRPKGPVKEGDIEYLLKRFQEEYDRTLIRKRFVLDTTTATIPETFAEFTTSIQPHLTDEDRLRLLSQLLPTRRAAQDAEIQYFPQDDLRLVGSHHPDKDPVHDCNDS